MTHLSEQHVYSISALNLLVKNLLQDAFPCILVEGELSNFARPSSGHWYFTLKDDKAQVRCAMFKMYNKMLDFEPEAGSQVVVKARVSLYEGRGDYQLIVEEMEEAGDGKLRRAFEKLKKQLHQEGLFSQEVKKPLPQMPKQIGVITSATGAALRDILTTLKRRFASIPVIIYPTAVQGSQAAPQIVQAINIANQRAECDILILARGGGSLEDLWPFNEEITARAIFASNIPIVSGIGHEVDITISDFVADARAATPTAAAELVSPQITEIMTQIKQIFNQLQQAWRQLIQNLSQECRHLEKRLQHPGQRLQQWTQRIDETEIRLQRAIKFLLEQKTHLLKQTMIALDTISPLATLGRGYAIVSDEKAKIISNVDQLTTGEKIKARFHTGSAECIVMSID